eukprot:3568861-Rhodomonas_salina.2
MPVAVSDGVVEQGAPVESMLATLGCFELQQVQPARCTPVPAHSLPNTAALHLSSLTSHLPYVYMAVWRVHSSDARSLGAGGAGEESVWRRRLAPNCRLLRPRGRPARRPLSLNPPRANASLEAMP